MNEVLMVVENKVQGFVVEKEIEIVNEMCISFSVIRGVKRLFVGQRVTCIERQTTVIGGNSLIKEKIGFQIENIMIGGI